MHIFGTVVDDFLPLAVVTKSPFLWTEVALVTLLVVSACLCKIKGVHYIVMPRGLVFSVTVHISAHHVLV